MKYNIPELVKAAIDGYVANKIPTGRFTRAVLENNLCDAIRYADKDSLAALPDIVGYVYNECPPDCWGSAKIVREWLGK